MSKTRFNRCAQVNGAVGGSLPSLRESVGTHCRVAGAAAESLRFLRRRALAGVGTIARRMGELGAKTPWYRMRLTRGRGSSLEQVVNRTVEDLFIAIEASIDDEMLKIPLADNSLAMRVFGAYEEHQTVLAPLISQCPAGLFVKPVGVVAALLLDRVIKVNRAPPMNEARKAYLVATMASMVHGVLSVWAGREFSEPAEWVANFMDTLLADGLQKVVLHGHR